MKLTRRVTIGCFFSSVIFFSSVSLAREWYFQPSAGVQTLYDTNIRLVADQSAAQNGISNRDAFGFVTYGNTNFGVRDDRYNVGVNATGVIKRYISDLDLDQENVYVHAKSNFNITERNIFSLNGGYVRDTVLGSVIDTTEFVQSNTPRSTLSINPQWTYLLSELSSIKLDYKYFDTSYEDRSQPNSQINSQQLQSVRFSNNTKNIASIELDHQWHPSINSYAIFDALIFDVPSRNQTTNNYNFNTGIDYKLSETWTTSLGIGVYVADTETDGVSDSKSGPLFSFKTKKKFDTSVLEAGYYRQTASRGSGGFSLVDVSYIGYRQQLSDRFNVGLKATYNDIEGLVSTNRSNYTFYSAGASATWIINPNLDLTGSYRFRFRASDGSSNNADSNVFLLSLDYKWDTFSTRKF